jgi:hypothetical protein
MFPSLASCARRATTQKHCRARQILIASALRGYNETRGKRAHLNRECEVRMQEIKPAREASARVGDLAARVEAEPRRFGWAPFLAAALGLALFAAVYFSRREHDLANEVARVRVQNSRQNIELTRVNQAFAILSGADTTVTTFGEARAKPWGKVFFSPSQGVLLIAGNLPPAPAGIAYEMWTVKGGQAKPAGMFQSAADGSAMHMQRGTAENPDAVAVTLEKEAGAGQPTSTALFTALLR